MTADDRVRVLRFELDQLAQRRRMVTMDLGAAATRARHAVLDPSVGEDQAAMLLEFRDRLAVQVDQVVAETEALQRELDRLTEEVPL